MTKAHSKYWATIGTAYMFVAFFGAIILFILSRSRQ